MTPEAMVKVCRFWLPWRVAVVVPAPVCPSKTGLLVPITGVEARGPAPSGSVVKLPALELTTLVPTGPICTMPLVGTVYTTQKREVLPEMWGMTAVLLDSLPKLVMLPLERVLMSVWVGVADRAL